MDAQILEGESAALAALVQAIARLELEEGYHSEQLICAAELLEENRFLAVRDGMDARLLDPVTEQSVPARALLRKLIDAARPHAEDLGCDLLLDAVEEMAHETGAERQRSIATETGQLSSLVEWLSNAFLS